MGPVDDSVTTDTESQSHKVHGTGFCVFGKTIPNSEIRVGFQSTFVQPCTTFGTKVDWKPTRWFLVNLCTTLYNLRYKG